MKPFTLCAEIPLIFHRKCDIIKAESKYKYAHGRADFIAKLEISLKETNETSRWLEMLWKCDYINEERYRTLDRKCSTIRFLLVKSITTAKKNINTAKEGAK